MLHVFDITDFGAVCDEKTDCSAAIQKALDAAAPVNGCVIVPPGRWLCADLKISRNVCLKGFDAWNFRQKNSSVLVLSRPDAKCLLNITGAIGCTVRDIMLTGNQLGTNIHGIMLDNPIYDSNQEEDSPTIENCIIGSFSGSAVYFNHVWCGTVRNNMLYGSANGIYHDGWDLFISGNWLSGNRGCGYRGGKLSSAVIFTNNRVEWNFECGMLVHQSSFININSNQFDRAGQVQLKIDPGKGYCRNVVVNGNSFNRSGSSVYSKWMVDEGYDSCHIFADHCVNLVISSNVFQVGRDGKDENGKKHFGPAYGIIYKHLRSSIIKDNVMQSGSVKGNLVDLGEHEEEVIVKDNTGSLMEGEDRWTAMLSDRDMPVIRSWFDLNEEEKKALGCL